MLRRKAANSSRKATFVWNICALVSTKAWQTVLANSKSGVSTGHAPSPAPSASTKGTASLFPEAAAAAMAGATDVVTSTADAASGPAAAEEVRSAGGWEPPRASARPPLPGTLDATASCAAAAANGSPVRTSATSSASGRCSHVPVEGSQRRRESTASGSAGLVGRTSLQLIAATSTMGAAAGPTAFTAAEAVDATSGP